MLRLKKFSVQLHTWANACPRKLGWSLGDCEPIVNRIRNCLFHTRDAARDGEEPPTHLGILKSLLSQISVEAINADVDDSDAQLTIPEPKHIEIDNREADHAEKLEHARDVLRRWQEHKNQNPQKPQRELVPISSDEGCHGEPKTLRYDNITRRSRILIARSPTHGRRNCP